jgi:hypothetical protein
MKATISAGKRRSSRSARICRPSAASPPARYRANHRRAVRSGTPPSAAARVKGTPSSRCGRRTANRVIACWRSSSVSADRAVRPRCVDAGVPSPGTWILPSPASYLRTSRA